MREQHLDQIMVGRGSECDIARAAAALSPMVAMVLQMVEGKEEDVPALARRLSEKICPIVNQATREMYDELFTDEQLAALAAFSTANPWFHELNGAMAERIHQITNERASPALNEIFEEYMPVPHEE